MMMAEREREHNEHCNTDGSDSGKGSLSVVVVVALLVASQCKPVDMQCEDRMVMVVVMRTAGHY